MAKYRISEIKTEIDQPMDRLPEAVAHRVGIDPSDISDWEVRRRSIDSRKKPHIQYVYTVDFVTPRNLLSGGSRRGRGRKGEAGRGGRKGKPVSGLVLVDEEKERSEITPPKRGEDIIEGRPVVVGMGPCGLFAGLELAKLGYRPLIIERGPAMEKRAAAVERFRKDRVLDPEANMLFGEGGAGTFSDGKIGTGIRDSLIRKVLTEFRDAGAGEEIIYLAKPHIGTDVLRTVIVNIRKKIEELGGEISFNTRLESLIIEDGKLTGVRITRSSSGTDAEKCPASASGEIIRTSALILAIGHSARDTFAMIHSSGLDMEQKAFSIGVRMEHPQRMIDEAQYGKENAERCCGDAREAEEQPGMLPPADYKINYKASNGRGVYSFCMCPGGEVVVCTTSDGELCVNGMSNRRRDSGTANSGILCDVKPEDFGSSDVLAGVRFQQKYERLAYINGGGDFTPPRCSMRSFLGEKYYDDGIAGDPDNTKRVAASLPDFAFDAIREAVPEFARRIHGYDDPDAVITAVETRSSSPVRILRDENGESNIRGIYPAGEGAGYAGGITSAAIDGIRAAWHIVSRYKPFEDQ